MGLDMYLVRKTWIGNQYKDPEKQVVINIPGIDQEKVSSITEQVGYWRKANAIHTWFVENVQNGDDDCKEHYVDFNKLEELRDCVIKVMNNVNSANELLPTASGFFFGSTDYDEYYFEDLKYTREILDNIIEHKPNNPYDYYYQSSW